MKKVLVLEDEANIRGFVVINLNRAGYETIEAGTGEEALEQLRLNPDVRVALLDIMLPDMDGFEVCRRIRADNLQRLLRERKIPAVVDYQNSAMPEKGQAVISVGALSAGSEYPWLQLAILTEGQLTARVS